MIIQDLRTIRITIMAIRTKTFTHRVRDSRLTVMCREIDLIVARHGQTVNGLFTASTEVRALRTIAHPGIGQETNREVEARLRLLEDLATFLIDKAEENEPAPFETVMSVYVASQPPQDTGEIPF